MKKILLVPLAPAILLAFSAYQHNIKRHPAP